MPPDLRNAMTAESAINDGLGLPLVILPILLMRQAPATAGLYWIVHVVGWEIGGAVAAGAAVGWANAKCMTWARGRPDADGASLLTVTISLALATMAGVHLLGADEILAAFVAGAVLNNVNRQAKVEEHHERFSETLGRFFDLPVMILFGAAIPWTAWSAIGTASGSGSGGSAGRGYSRHSSRCWHSAVRPRTWSSSSTARPRAPTSRRPGQKGAAAPGARPIARWVLDQNPPQDRQRLDKLRARIEQTIGKLKLFKRVAMRREKTDISLLSHYQLRMQSDAG